MFNTKANSVPTFKTVNNSKLDCCSYSNCWPASPLRVSQIKRIDFILKSLLKRVPKKSLSCDFMIKEKRETQTASPIFFLLKIFMSTFTPLALG